MATRGFLIRFIDIGLIVLFGFLLISDIEAASRVELSGGSADVVEDSPADEEEGAVLVRIGPDGTFYLTDLTEGVGATAVALPNPTREEAVAALEEGLRLVHERHRARELRTLVLIEPHPASVVQRTVDVMDLCDRLGLAKGLRMDIEVDRGPSGEPLP